MSIVNNHLISTIYDFAEPLNDVIKIQERLYEMFGPIVRLDATLGRPTFIILYDPECCAQVNIFLTFYYIYMYMYMYL